LKEIAILDVTDNKRLVLSLGEYRGIERIDLRQYVKPRDDEKYIPTPKGVNFSSEWLPDFVKMVNKLNDV